MQTVHRNNITVTGIAVTFRGEDQQEILGIPIYEIQELSGLKDESVIILGVKSKKDRADIILELKRLGFKKYIEID